MSHIIILQIIWYYIFGNFSIEIINFVDYFNENFKQIIGIFLLSFTKSRDNSLKSTDKRVNLKFF